MIHLSALVLPGEFVGLLKTSATAGGGSLPVIDVLRKSPGLNLLLERAFHEFNEHKIGIEKIVTTLGWSNFRDRMASVYVFKALHGTFPDSTELDLIAPALALEARFTEKSVTGTSRLFLLGFYLRFLNVYLRMKDEGAAEVAVPASVDRILALRTLKTDRPDWLILLCWHLDQFLGTDAVVAGIERGEAWPAFYEKLTAPQKFQLHSNLLSYGASIQDDDPFLYERI